MQDPIQANAKGAAFIAGVGLGAIQFNDVPRLVTYKCVYRPTPANRTLYDDRYEAFVEIYRRMKGVYRKLNGA